MNDPFFNNPESSRYALEKQSLELLRSISAASPMAIYIMQGGIIKYTSRQFQSLTGYSQREMYNKDMLDIVPGADKDVVQASTVFTLKGEKSYPCEYRVLHKNGQVKWVMQTVAPIHFESGEAILGSLMDITERKYLERKVFEYEELNKMKGDILAAVSHELRTPLAAIKGYATMMLDHQSRISRDESMEYLISINNSADRLMDLVNNLLDSSRLDSGMLELKKSPASIRELIKSVVKIASLRLSGHPIITIFPVSCPRIDIDEKRVKQVLENLIFNAVDHSPPGREILISTAKKKGFIEISVTDYGPMIPARELKSIFDRMYKVENMEYGGADGGMGLGLHICQRLVEAHGGAIRAQSMPDKGTILSFSLPIAPDKKRVKRRYRQNKPGSLIL